MSTSAELRARVARAVADVAQRGRSLDSLLDDLPDNPRERGLLRSLTFDSVRWFFRLDALLKRLLANPRARLDEDIHALGIVGLCQLLYSETPPHAVVAETVNATRVLGKPRAAGLINAVLRRCQRDGDEILRDLDRDLAVASAHPRWLLDALHKEWPEEFREILAANNARPPMWVRVNRQRSTTEAYLSRLAEVGIEATPFAAAPEALLLSQPVEVRDLPGFAEGDVSIQDAAAQHAAHLLGACPGDRVLDLCAAPGGKSCHILELESQVRELVAVDSSATRLERVRENLVRLNLKATVIAGDGGRPASWWDGKPFDRIMLDVPCSATGVIRRHPDIKLLRRASDIASLAKQQRALLANAWSMLAPGGRLVYASCSQLAAENADVVQTFLHEHSDARERAVEIPVNGKRDSSRPGVRIAAGDAGRDGFYYACLEKRSDLKG